MNFTSSLRRVGWGAAVGVCVVAWSAGARADDRVSGGVSVAGGVQAPTQSEVGDLAVRAKSSPAFGVALQLSVPLSARVSFVVGGGVAGWSWVDVGPLESVDTTVFVVSAAPGARLRLGDAGLYVGAGGVVGKTLPVAITRQSFPGDVALDAKEERSFSVLGPSAEVGVRVGPERLFDLGVRTAWLRGAPGDPVVHAAYAGAWF